MNLKEEFSLEQLIDSCCDTGSPFNGRAWTLLLERYQNYIYKIISKRCQRANINRINLDFSDTVNEIFNEVIIKLCNNNCKALRDFRHKDNERVFLAWLARVANSATYHYITKYYLNQATTMNIDVMKNYLSGVSIELQSQMYEDQVRLLRASVKSAKNIERDINIFIFNVWQGFDLEMLFKVPCLQGVTDKVVYNVVHRMRNYLSANWEFLN